MFRVQGIDLSVQLLSNDLFPLLWLGLSQQLHNVCGGCLHTTSSGCGCHTTWDRGYLSWWGRLVANCLVELHLQYIMCNICLYNRHTNIPADSACLLVVAAVASYPYLHEHLAAVDRMGVASGSWAPLAFAGWEQSRKHVHAWDHLARA